MTAQLYMPQDGWTEAAHAKLNAAIARILQDGAPSPIAVFDFDQTCIYGDIGELFSHYLIEEMAYRFDLQAFWDLIDPRDGRDHIRGLIAALAKLPGDARRQSEEYREYLAELGAVYERKYHRDGAAACYEWAVRLHVGMTPAQIHRLTLEAMRREIQAPITREVRHTARGESVVIERGIRIHQEIRTLMGVLERLGFEVWIVSATNRWSVEAFARHSFGIPASRVLGNQLYGQAPPDEPLRLCARADDELSSTTCLPVLYRQGKVDIIREQVGRRPALAFGDTTTDFEMLCDATELAVLIDRGLPELQHEAHARSWAVQPHAQMTRSDQLSFSPEDSPEDQP